MMAHYAVLDENNVVVSVFVGRDEGDGGVDWERYYAESAGLPASRVRRTSYNTVGGVHLHGGTPYRENYAAIGFTFDPGYGPDGAFVQPSCPVVAVPEMG